MPWDMCPLRKGMVMDLVARPFAGPGTPGTALMVLQAAGWTVKKDPAANAYVSAPDHRHIAAFLPERNDFAPGGPLWVIRAYDEPPVPVPSEPAWEATFTEGTPAEFIAAFLTDLVNPTPLDPDRDDDAFPLTVQAD